MQIKGSKFSDRSLKDIHLMLHKMMSSAEMKMFYVPVHCTAAVQCSKALYAVLVKAIQYSTVLEYFNLEYYFLSSLLGVYKFNMIIQHVTQFSILFIYVYSKSSDQTTYRTIRRKN